MAKVVDELATGDLYWDPQTIRDWAEGLQRGMGSFPGIPRMSAGESGPPWNGGARDSSDADRDPPS